MVRNGYMLELNSGDNGDFAQPWCLVKLKLRYDGPSSWKFNGKAGGVQIHTGRYLGTQNEAKGANSEI